jgi:hypothetical protein
MGLVKTEYERAWKVMTIAEFWELHGQADKKNPQDRQPELEIESLK